MKQPGMTARARRSYRRPARRPHNSRYTEEFISSRIHSATALFWGVSCKRGGRARRGRQRPITSASNGPITSSALPENVQSEESDSLRVLHTWLDGGAWCQVRCDEADRPGMTNSRKMCYRRSRRRAHPCRAGRVVRPRSLRITEALVEGGVGSIEITMTVPGRFDVIRDVSERFRDRGMRWRRYGGPRWRSSRVHSCRARRFIVSPAVVPDVIRVARARDVVMMPGAFTPTEVLSAWLRRRCHQDFSCQSHRGRIVSACAEGTVPGDSVLSDRRRVARHA